MNTDTQILRELGRVYAEAAALPLHDEKADLWRRLNRLEPVRPLVLINEIPWHEMNVDDELTLRCQDPACRGLENHLRCTLYQWRHFPGDMVLDPVLYSSYVFSDTGYGIEQHTRSSGMEMGAVDYIPTITALADLEKIRTPEITPDWGATERNYLWMAETFDGILPVEKRGVMHEWCAAWDNLVRWYGIQELYTDMTDNPELVRESARRYMEATNARLDQLETYGLLSTSNNNFRVGSGGLGITDQLPQPDCDAAHVRPLDQWGTATGQIFSEVSPAMHEEFCLQFERPYLERFGLSCYGCCEPLHYKVGILRSVRNLRRISMSPFIDLEAAVEAVGADYIFSSKPNPAYLAGEAFHPDHVHAHLREILERTRGCRVELILKDIHTLRGKPQRLWEWEGIAMQMVEEYA